MSESEVLQLAKGLAETKGWPWSPPFRVALRRPWLGSGGKWEIFSNANKLGSAVRVVIDDETGEILECGYIPR